MSSNAPPTLTPPKILVEIFEKIIGPIMATQVASLLHEPDHIEERVAKIKSAFVEHPELEEPFQQLIKTMQNQEGMSSIEEQIRFFTTKHARYWILVNLANRVLKIKELKLDPATGRLPGKPHTLLNFTHQGRLALGEDSRYKDVLSSVGFMFDMVFYLQRSEIFGPSQQKFDEPINLAFKKAVDQAKKAVILNKFHSKLEYEKLVTVMPFLRQLAQICLCLMNPSQGFELYKKLDTPPNPKLSEPLRMALERKTFGISSAMVASALAECFPIFDPLGECMTLWGAPYLLGNHSSKHAVIQAVGMGQLTVATNEWLNAGYFAKSGTVKFVMPELHDLDFDYNKEVIIETKI